MRDLRCCTDVAPVPVKPVRKRETQAQYVDKPLKENEMGFRKVGKSSQDQSGWVKVGQTNLAPAKLLGASRRQSRRNFPS